MIAVTEHDELVAELSGDAAEARLDALVHLISTNGEPLRPAVRSDRCPSGPFEGDD